STWWVLSSLESELEGGDGGGGDLAVLRHRAAGNADGADDGAVRSDERDAAGERRKAAVRQLETGCRRAGLAILPDGLARRREEHGRARLPERDVDGAEHRAIHAQEGLEMRAGIEHGDVDGNADPARPLLAGGNHLLRLPRRDHGCLLRHVALCD